MKLQNSYNKITKVEVHDLCNQLETRLPDEYIDFLLLYNGGQAEKNRYTKIGATGEIYFDFYVNVFYGIGGSDTSYDILTMFSIYCELIPESLLPIGDDGVGNIICIGIDDDCFGNIYIWWKKDNLDEDEEPNFENVDLLDDSLVGFLKGFQ